MQTHLMVLVTLTLGICAQMILSGLKTTGCNANSSPSSNLTIKNSENINMGYEKIYISKNTMIK